MAVKRSSKRVSLGVPTRRVSSTKKKPKYEVGQVIDHHFYGDNQSLRLDFSGVVTSVTKGGRWITVQIREVKAVNLDALKYDDI
jgi:hypothetical protein